jgi:hypothetical protein
MDLMDPMDHQLKEKKKVIMDHMDLMDHQKLSVQNVEKNLNSQKGLNIKKQRFIDLRVK